MDKVKPSEELKIYLAVSKARKLVAEGVSIHAACAFVAPTYGVDVDLVIGFVDAAVTGRNRAVEAQDGPRLIRNRTHGLIAPKTNQRAHMRR